MDNHTFRNSKSQNSKIDNSEEARKADALSSPEVRREMREAWERSEADAPEERHEEGGYIVFGPDGSLQVVPWPQGERGLIEMSERDADGKYKGLFVVSSYHTHPNPPIDEEGKRWEQSPSEIDIEMIIREKYSGDSFVISDAIVYRVKPDGRVKEVGEREKTLS